MHRRVHGSLRRLVIVALALVAGCVSKPITIRTLDRETGAPIEGADVRQHGARFFHFFPGTAAAKQTDPEGQLALVLNARATNLAILRPGYIPTQIAIVPRPSGLGVPPEELGQIVAASPSNYIEFESIAAGSTIEVAIEPTHPRAVRVCVRSESGRLMPGVEVVAHAGLFLPRDGVEARWGLPPIQYVITGGDGCATVTVHEGLRNYLTARAAGFDRERRTLDDVPEHGDVTLTLRSLEFKSVSFRVVDATTGAPIKGASVELGKEMDGITRDPNGWSVQTDATGCTGSVRIPHSHELSVVASKVKYRSNRRLMRWQFVGEGHCIELALERS